MSYRLDTCRSCDADIIWARTEAGKSIPVDPAAHEDGNVLLAGSSTDPKAFVLGPLEVEQRREKARRRPSYTWPRLRRAHFVTCPQADRWRRS